MFCAVRTIKQINTEVSHHNSIHIPTFHFCAIHDAS